MSEPDNKYRQVAIVVASAATDSERAALVKWAQGLVAIRDSPGSALSKSKYAVRLTIQSEVTWPLVKLLARELKRIGWDERGGKSRGFLVGGGLGLLAFGGQGAGIAALGTAIGVPLWVVLGGGGALIAALIEELHKRRAPNEPARSQETTTYRVIDATKDVRSSDSSEVSTRDQSGTK